MGAWTAPSRTSVAHCPEAARSLPSLPTPGSGQRERAVGMTERIATQHDRLLSLNEAAERLGLCHWTVRKWLARGRLPFHRVGSRAIRIAESDLEKLIAAGRHEAHPDLALDGVAPDDDDGDEA